MQDVLYALLYTGNIIRMYIIVRWHRLAVSSLMPQSENLIPHSPPPVLSSTSRPLASFPPGFGVG